MKNAYETYDDVRARLDEIVDAVNSDDVALDEALGLYEEAVKLGLLACDLSEDEVEEFAASEEADEAALVEDASSDEDRAIAEDTAQAEDGVQAAPLNQSSTLTPGQIDGAASAEDE